MHPFCHREMYAMASPLPVIRAPVVCGARMRAPYGWTRVRRQFSVDVDNGMAARICATPISA